MSALQLRLNKRSNIELMDRVFGSLFRTICCTKIEKKNNSSNKKYQPDDHVNAR